MLSSFPAPSSVDVRRMLPAAAGIRGFACLWVMVIHNFGFFVFPPGSVDGCGKIGVWLFFVLSAYLLTYKLVASGTSMPVLAAYAWGRFWRIIPAFVVAVLFYRFAGTAGIN